MPTVGISAKASIDGAQKFQDDLKAMSDKGKLLDAQMKELTSSFKADGKSQEEMQKKAAMTTKQIDAQREKAKLLSDWIAKLKDRQEELTAQLKKLTDAGQGESKEAANLRKEIQSNSTAITKYETELAKTNTRINEYSKGQKDAGESTAVSTGQLIKAGVALGALKTAAGAVVGAIKGIANAAVNAAKGVWNLGVSSGQWADALITEGNQFGLDVETLQEWGYAARFIDTEVSSMEKSMLKLRPALTKKNGVAKKSIKIDKKHTVAIRDQNGEVRKETEIFYDVIDALHDMSNVQARNRKAQELFGKSYTEMIPLIESGSGALRQYAAEARSMGIIISTDNVGALGQFDDTMQRFDATLGAIKTNLAVAFLPILELVAGRLEGFMATVSAAISDGLQPSDVGTIVDAFFAMFTPEMTDEERQSENALGFLSELIKTLKDKIIEHKDDLKAIAKTIISAFWDGFKEVIGIDEDSTAYKIWTNIKNGIAAIFGFVASDPYVEGEGTYAGLTAAEWYANGFTEAFPEIEGAADEAGGLAYGAMEEHIGPSAHSKSTHWGKEFATGYADGIRQGIPEVSAASDAMAKAAAAPIHYSLPDYGPLREVGKWGGEMIDKYVAGINRNVWKVSSAIDSALPMGRTNNYGGVSINVYGSAGQDVNQLADIIMARMQNAVNRREAVFA